MLLIQEKATLTVGDDGRDNLKIHNLDSVQLPEMEEMNEAHQAGGAMGEVEWGGLGMKALSPSFKLKGWDPQVLSFFYKKTRSPFTVRGSIRDKQLQTLVGVKAVIFGRVGKISVDSFEAGKILGHDHTMHEVVHYALYYNDLEKIYWDHFEVAFRIDGVDQLADERRILALPGA